MIKKCKCKKCISFWKQVQKDYEEVQKWPLWMRQIVINANTAASGQFIDRSIK